MKRFLLAILVALGLFIASSSAPAQEAGTRPPERIIRPMRAVDPVTLKAEGISIRLWGVKPAMTLETPLELGALDLLDRLINEQQVNCTIAGGIVPELIGRCMTPQQEDLALKLLESGFVVVDRRQTYNTVFAASYETAQETAHLKSRGVWRYTTQDEGESTVPAWLKPYLEWLVPLALIFGPFGGLLVVAMVMRAGLARLGAQQENVMEEAQRHEAGLQSRERQVLVSALQGELTENRNKIEAFGTIYGDLLRGLKTPAVEHKYQQVGDIVQKSPVFSKAVFEANVGKLSLLNIKAAGMVSKLYSSLPVEQEFVNLDPDVPLETAVRLVEKILADAESFRKPIDDVLVELKTAE